MVHLLINRICKLEKQLLPVETRQIMKLLSQM